MSQLESINQEVASRLREGADLLEQQAANPFRISVYRHAADRVIALEEDLRDIVECDGIEGPTELLDIGRDFAAATDEILQTGSSSQLARFRGALEPGKLFQIVPNVSIRRVRHSCRFCIRSETIGISLHCFQTPRESMSWDASTTGW